MEQPISLWFLNVLISAVVSSVLSFAVVQFCSRKIRLEHYLRQSGISRIYLKGRSVKAMEKQFKSEKCKEIRILAFSAAGILGRYGPELTEFVASGGHLKVLLARPTGEFIQQVYEMEYPGGSVDNAANSINHSVYSIKSIYHSAQEKALKRSIPCGSVEIRYYDTEIRNPLILCSDGERTYAWLTVFLPPLTSINCQMLEYSDPDDCINYFETIWARHENNKEPL